MPIPFPNTTIPSSASPAGPRPRGRLRACWLAAALLLAAAPVLPPPAHAEDEAPSPPAAAPPAPVVLGDKPTGHGTPAATLPPIALVPGIQAIPDGGWKLTGAAAQSAPTSGILAVLSEIGRAMADQKTGRVTILAQVAGPKDDESVARRASLAQAQAVRQALEAGGLASTRIDLRPLGLTAEATDAVTILPPGTPQPTIQR